MPGIQENQLQPPAKRAAASKGTVRASLGLEPYRVACDSSFEGGTPSLRESTCSEGGTPSLREAAWSEGILPSILRCDGCLPSK